MLLVGCLIPAAARIAASVVFQLRRSNLPQSSRTSIDFSAY
jgi:hypothetical protein